MEMCIVRETINYYNHYKNQFGIKNIYTFITVISLSEI